MELFQGMKKLKHTIYGFYGQFINGITNSVKRVTCRVWKYENAEIGSKLSLMYYLFGTDILKNTNPNLWKMSILKIQTVECRKKVWFYKINFGFQISLEI